MSLAMATVATYRPGPPVRPPIVHDNGFLDAYAPRPAGMADRALLLEWRAILELGEAGQGVPLVPHNHLPDALAAYRHFLYGHGTDRVFSYERYVSDDQSGQTTLDNALLDFRRGVEDVLAGGPPASPATFHLTGSAISCGANPFKFPELAALFPYPATENWQKAIGAHYIWLSGTINMLGAGTFDAIVTLHAEDRYNFNKNNLDIATKIPDSANGRFEVTGLAQQYTNYAQLVRQVKWKAPTGASAEVIRIDNERQRKPHDNRRARNRL